MSKYSEYQFIEQIKREKGRTDFMSRGHIIDMLSDNDDKWCDIIRALLLGENKILINVLYLIEKVNYCKDHPTEPERFLKGKYLQIFKSLQLK